jgi:hypothetical protein
VPETPMITRESPAIRAPIPSVAVPEQSWLCRPLRSHSAKAPRVDGSRGRAYPALGREGRTTCQRYEREVDEQRGARPGTPVEREVPALLAVLTLLTEKGVK